MLTKVSQTSVDKGLYSQGYGLHSGHIQLWELDREEGRAMTNWCPRTVVLEKTLESHLDRKEIKLVNLKGNQPWILIGRIDAEAEAPVFWSSDVNRLIGKVPDARKDWGQKEKRVTEEKMDGGYHQCNEHELGQTPGDGEGQWGLACCSSWGCRVGLNWATEQLIALIFLLSNFLSTDPHLFLGHKFPLLFSVDNWIWAKLSPISRVLFSNF